MSRHLATGAMLALGALTLAGCGDVEGYRFEVHPADGRVLRDGAPVAGAYVRFHPDDPASVQVPEGEEGLTVMLTTQTDQDGRFAMSTYLADDGVPAGDYTVTVVADQDPAGSDVENADGKVLAPPPRRPDPYREPATSPLKATVAPGENHFVFELE
jgi:hypothetical protein